MPLFAIAAPLAALLAVFALAQPGNPAFMTFGTGPEQVNNTDRLATHALAIGGIAEVAFGKLAQEKGQSDAVKEFGGLMAEDHGSANEQLKAIAEANGTALPKKLDAEHIAIQERLAGLEGAAFDAAYLQVQVAAHQKTAQLLEHEIGSGQDVDLKAFASKALPVVLRHLQLARDAQLVIDIPELAPADAEIQ